MVWMAGERDEASAAEKYEVETDANAGRGWSAGVVVVLQGCQLRVIRRLSHDAMLEGIMGDGEGEGE